MNRCRLILIYKFVALFFIFCTSPSSATPPLSIKSHDHPIAVSQSHIYVMRNVSDNMGRYQAERSKTYVLKLEIKTSKLVEFHILQEAIQSESDMQSTITANKDFNLFAYLEHEKAFQIGSLGPRSSQKIIIEKKDDFSILSRNFSDQIDGQYKNKKENTVIHDENLISWVNSSISGIISEYIGPIPHPIPNVEIYTISQNFDPQSGDFCTISKALNAPQPISKSSHRKRSNEFIVYVTCRSTEHELYVDAILPLALSFTPAK